MTKEKGCFSEEDMINCWNASEANSVMREHTQKSFTAEDYIDSLPKCLQQKDGREMELLKWLENYNYSPTYKSWRKNGLTNDLRIESYTATELLQLFVKQNPL